MTQSNYFTTLTTRNFLYPQSRIVARLLLDNKSKKEISIQIKESNLFQLKSKDRIERFTNTIISRLSYLSEGMIQSFLSTDPLTSKAILLYGILRSDALFYEWMREVVWEKKRILDWTLYRRETEQFLERKEEQSEKVRSWNNETKTRLTNAYHQVLLESGYGIKTEQGITLQFPFIEPSVKKQFLSIGQDRIMEIILGEVLA